MDGPRVLSWCKQEGMSEAATGDADHAVIAQYVSTEAVGERAWSSDEQWGREVNVVGL